MKHILVATFITLLVLGTGCAWISPSSQTTSDGIQVHGHWNVTVSNPDGSVDAVHEFDNELAPGGKVLLVKLLAGSQSVYFSGYDSQWTIAISSESPHVDLPDLGDSVACQEQTSKASKYIYLPANIAFSSDLFSLDLTATCTITTDASSMMEDQPYIGRVGTHTGLLDAGLPSFPPYPNILTAHHFGADQLIKIQENQTLVFNIRIRFN